MSNPSPDDELSPFARALQDAMGRKGAARNATLAALAPAPAADKPDEPPPSPADAFSAALTASLNHNNTHTIAPTDDGPAAA